MKTSLLLAVVVSCCASFTGCDSTAVDYVRFWDEEAELTIRFVTSQESSEKAVPNTAHIQYGKHHVLVQGTDREDFLEKMREALENAENRYDITSFTVETCRPHPKKAVFMQLAELVYADYGLLTDEDPNEYERANSLKESDL